MRCLGATQGFLLRVYLGQFVLLGVGAALLGCLFGYAAHFLLNVWLLPMLAMPLPTPTLLPAVQGMAVGLLLLFGFAVPPLIQLKSVSTLRVLRRELGVAGPGLLGGYLLGLLALAGLMLWIAGEVRLGAYVVGGFTAALLLFAAFARLAIRLATRLRLRLRPQLRPQLRPPLRQDLRSPRPSHGAIGWRYGLASLERHSTASVLQIVALALGFMALLLLTVTRGDLVDAWRRATPLDAPNRFLINIQPEQVANVEHAFSAAGLKAELMPMVRGRLTRLNGLEVSAASYEDERAKRLVDREFNLSWRADLPEGNVVTAGRWFAPDERGHGLTSIEDGLAKTLGLKVGDRIEFTVAGEKIDMTVSGLRKLDWDTMRVNFFVLTPPGVLEPYPTSWITSFYLPSAQADFTNRLVRDFPNLTVIDVAAILRQVQTIIDQVVLAVQFVFLFTLAAGVIVLYAALASSADERRYELVLMRALGARRDQLRGALLTEFAAVGSLAGLIAALGAIGVGQLLARNAFLFEVAINYWLLPAAMLGGALLVCTAGWLAAVRLLRTPPMEALRAGT
jgi:putative ABC transport system permease protein